MEKRVVFVGVDWGRINMNDYINLLFILSKKSARDSIKPIKCPPPFDNIIQDMYKSSMDLTKEDILVLCSTHNVPLPTINQIISHEFTISPAIEEITLVRLDALAREQEILNVFKSNEPIEQKIKRIQEISIKLVEPTKSQAKKVSELDNTHMDELCSFLGYPLMRGELGLLCAFPGRGKTTVLLSTIREYTNQGLNCLYISIEDFTEQTLRKRLPSGFPDVLVACVPVCSFRQIRKESDTHKPDVLIVDYLDVVNMGRHLTDPRLKHNAVVHGLKSLAQELNIVVLSAHQLNSDVLEPQVEHLAESKFGILAGVDVCLGMGGYVYDTRRYITTMKSRRHPPLTTFKINVDFNKLVIQS